MIPLPQGLPLYACPDHEERDGHVHEHSKRAVPSAPLTPPSRPLEWGDVNIIHTTDSHGWLLGHQKTSFPEPNYSGDFGDFSSFVAHMKELAIQRDVDLLLVDTGDLHDGTGLSDGFPPGGVDAHDSNQFFKELPYDVLAIGNHELYIYANTLDMHTNFVPQFNGRYLSQMLTLLVPVGSEGRQVTAFGVLFDFTGNDKNTTVQKVEDMVKEQWFAEAIKEEPDFFLLTGHMPVARDNWPFVFNTIRAVHPTTPILILGGHTHIRDCLQLDGRSMALESGRYMETVGWLSAKLDKKGSKKNITFSRRYLDPNRVTYEFHTGKKFNFDTSLGKQITQGLNNLAKKFDLSFLFGTAPRDFTLTQAPYPSNNSLLSLFIGNATPTALAINNTRASIPNIIIANSGSQRFDIYSGPFTKNDQLTASPFTDAFFLPALNNAGADERRSLDALEERERELYSRGYVGKRYREWLREMDRRASFERRAAKNLTLGYVTSDACPGVGDDTLHAPWNSILLPISLVKSSSSIGRHTVDLVFVDFIESQLLGILNGIQENKTILLLGLYAQIAWN
ncbi:Metallo-dependent phosphatase-like protein [Cyathus striatus]|nr:Metallo-dependent phosphatase-like protein [Cyathus striatus]